MPNYNYSPALKNSGVTWDAKTLDAYLTDPQKLIPGNKMPFPGLKSQGERADVIAYMVGGSAPAQTAQATPSAREPPPPRPAAAPANTGDRTGKKSIGPSMANIVGKKAASDPIL